jgi:hypothetical protein
MKRRQCESEMLLSERLFNTTPILFSKYNCKVFLKREDLQVVRSYKLRAAFRLEPAGAPSMKTALKVGAAVKPRRNYF